MLSRFTSEKTLLTPKITSNYVKPKLISEASYYHVYEAFHKESGELHSIRALHVNSTFFKKDKNRVITLFLQEILRICVQLDSPQSLILEHFDVSGDRICFVSKNCSCLQYKLSNINDSVPEINAEKLLKGVESDIRFLYAQMKLSNLTISLKNIYKIDDSYFLGDWALATTAASSIAISKARSDLPLQSFAINETLDLVLLTLELNVKSPDMLQGHFRHKR